MGRKGAAGGHGWHGSIRLNRCHDAVHHEFIHWFLYFVYRAHHRAQACRHAADEESKSSDCFDVDALESMLQSNPCREVLLDIANEVADCVAVGVVDLHAVRPPPATQRSNSPSTRRDPKVSSVRPPRLTE